MPRNGGALKAGLRVPVSVANRIRRIAKLTFLYLYKPLMLAEGPLAISLFASAKLPAPESEMFRPRPASCLSSLRNEIPATPVPCVQYCGRKPAMDVFRNMSESRKSFTNAMAVTNLLILAEFIGMWGAQEIGPSLPTLAEPEART